MRKYLRADQAPEFKACRSRSSKLDPFKDYLQQRVAAAHPDWIPATVLFDEIKAMGYPGGRTILCDYMATLKPRRRPDPLVRFETAAGQQMQVDWAAFRLGSMRLSAFVAPWVSAATPLEPLWRMNSSRHSEPVTNKPLTGIVKLTGYRGSKPPHRVFKRVFTDDILGMAQLVVR